MILGDVGIHKVGKEAYLKFEQGKLQKDFLYHLFNKFQEYTFMEKPGIRYNNNKDIKSYWFKTFSHHTFSDLRNLFYDLEITKQKIIKRDLIKTELTALGLAYWIMCDGSLQNDKKSLILHTQGFNEDMNKMLSDELNIKFNIHSRVITHKHKYFVIFIPKEDCKLLNKLINPFMIDYFNYKIPQDK
jgi:sulfur relay (sulfurtransferase) DsrC/TusE family protein